MVKSAADILKEMQTYYTAMNDYHAGLEADPVNKVLFAKAISLVHSAMLTWQD